MTLVGKGDGNKRKSSGANVQNTGLDFTGTANKMGAISPLFFFQSSNCVAFNSAFLRINKGNRLLLLNEDEDG